MAVDNIYDAGIAGGWKVRDASTFDKNITLEADIVIVGKVQAAARQQNCSHRQDLKC